MDCKHDVNTENTMIVFDIFFPVLSSALSDREEVGFISSLVTPVSNNCNE